MLLLRWFFNYLCLRHVNDFPWNRTDAFPRRVAPVALVVLASSRDVCPTLCARCRHNLTLWFAMIAFVLLHFSSQLTCKPICRLGQLSIANWPRSNGKNKFFSSQLRCWQVSEAEDFYLVLIEWNVAAALVSSCQWTLKCQRYNWDLMIVRL